MKVIILGYEGSRKIRKQSEYLFRKYTPYEPIYLEYTGEIEGWAKFVKDYLQTLTDKVIIFALDDYLISAPMRDLFPPKTEYDCIKLCEASLEENEEYPVTTQYTVWKRQYLIDILSLVHTPWEFEIEGSRLHKNWGRIALHDPVLRYNTNSSISGRWAGIDYKGLKAKDLETIKEMKL